MKNYYKSEEVIIPYCNVCHVTREILPEVVDGKMSNLTAWRVLMLNGSEFLLTDDTFIKNFEDWLNTQRIRERMEYENLARQRT